MILQGICKKCNSPVKLDIGDNSLKDTIEKLQNMQSFECPGHHVELSSPYPNYWDVHNWEFVEGKAPTEEEFLATLRSTYQQVRTTDEMRGLITGFASGYPITNDGLSWEFVHSPAGKRWYVTNG